MRVLMYNWCPLLDSEGGGVSVYLRNIVETLAVREDIEVVFLNSGFYYDQSGKTYLRLSENVDWHGVESYDIVNSPVVAPMKSPVDNIERFLNSTELNNLFLEFLSEQKIDVVHFQNLEGLSLEVLSLKNQLPGIKFIYSLHNYVAFCPCVNLWRSDNKNCFVEGNRDCCRCMAKYALPSTERKKRLRERKNPKAYLAGRVETHAMYAIASKTHAHVYDRNTYADLFKLYREKVALYVNTYMDAVLAVSERVRNIALSFGFKPSIVTTEYIGTRFAEHQVDEGHPQLDDMLHLVFMGYMKKEKGLPFLIQALMHMDEGDAKRLNITIAAKLSDPGVFLQIKKLEHRVGNLTYLNGYTHEQLPGILSKQDLGVVPVLWEDNLPQVAIELAASGVPVLSSTFGGASELTKAPGFAFEGGSEDALIECLKRFVHDKSKLDEYWAGRIHFVTMPEHIERLCVYYR